MFFALSVFAGCGELMSDNAGSQHSLLEDREACAREIDPTSAAFAYRQNPTARPEYVNQVFTDLNQCIERKGGSKYGLSKSWGRCVKRSRPNWFKQSHQRHAQVLRPQKRLCGGSKRDSEVAKSGVLMERLRLKLRLRREKVRE